jgi:hypothetical protein
MNRKEFLAKMARHTELKAEMEELKAEMEAIEVEVNASGFCLVRGQSVAFTSKGATIDA